MVKTADQVRIEEAAEKFRLNDISYRFNHHAEKHFKAGVQWRDKNLHPAIDNLIDQANQILLLTHPELSNVEMNTITTRQYILWKQAKEQFEKELGK